VAEEEGNRQTKYWLMLHDHLCQKFVICQLQIMEGSQDSVVSIMTGYGLGDGGVGVQILVGSRIFSPPRYPDRLWGPPSLLSNGYQGLLPRGYSGWGVNLTTHPQLVPRSRKYGSTHPFPHMPSWHSA
jgi:hypothetical protein